MKIIIDAMGGDNAPDSNIEGTLAALKQFPDVSIILVGDQPRIEQKLSGADYDRKRLTIVPTTEAIEMGDKPVEAIKRKKDSSLVVGLNLLASGVGEVLMTAGSTGAMVAGATIIAGRIRGVKRPALAPVLPTAKGSGVLLIDCGANADCKAGFLAQFALMGSAYMRAVMGIDKPRVALLSNGTEEEKGSELVKEAHAMLSALPINFVGNCEGSGVLSGDYDVCVCDGFSGNVLLKGIEGSAKFLMTKLKEGIMSSGVTKLGGALCKPAFAQAKASLDHTQYGGALLLGVNGGVIKTHGSSDVNTILNAVRQARSFITGDVMGLITQAIEGSVIDD